MRNESPAHDVKQNEKWDGGESRTKLARGGIRFHIEVLHIHDLSCSVMYCRERAISMGLNMVSKAS